ncbi:MAG: hypothetical protein IJ740_02015 [Ruminococcus sp.]|nr:hypothetical protein [Ruminococcus sp.]
MFKHILTSSLALSLLFATAAYLPEGVVAKSTITAQAEEDEQVKFTYIITDKKLGEHFFKFYEEENEDNTYTASYEKGKNIGICLGYFWLHDDTENYYITQWKDTATGKIYDHGEEIKADKDMTFESVWHKKAVITYITLKKDTDLFPYGGDGKGIEYRAEGTLSYVGLLNDDYTLGIEIEEWPSTAYAEYNDDGSLKNVKYGIHLGWRCEGDGIGRIYKQFEKFYPTGDATFVAVWDYGWNEDSQGKWYLNEDGTYPVDTTVTIDGAECTFDKYGYLTKKVAKAVTKTSLSKCKATLSKTSYTYSGKAKKPAVTVKNGKTTLKKGTDYTVTYKNNTKIGKATVTIKGKGSYTGTITKTFKINPKNTTVKKLTSPKTKQLKVTYKKVSGVTGYQVTYSTSKKFTKSTTKTATIKGVSKLSKTVKSLKKGKTYYVKVRTYKTVSGTKYYSAYTAVKKIKTK